MLEVGLSHMSNTTHESVDTRERLLDAAGKLFAERGFEATSVRDITSEAGCNVASVNYYFGGKENLYVEAFRALLAELRDIRIETIRRDMARVVEPTLEYFLETFAAGFLGPIMAEGRGRQFVVIINREMADPHLPRELFVEEFLSPMMAEAGEALLRVAPTLDPAAARLCLMSMVSQLLHALMFRKHFVPDGRPPVLPGDFEAHVKHIVRFTAGGIRACTGESYGPVTRSNLRSE